MPELNVWQAALLVVAVYTLTRLALRWRDRHRDE